MITFNKNIIIILSLISGVVSSFGLPPYNLFILNFFTLPIFFILTLHSLKIGKMSSFLCGLSFGFGYYISSLYWITNALTFDENLKFLIPISFISIPVFLGSFYGLGTLITSYFRIKKNYSSVLIFALLISLSDYLRGQIFTGFPWQMFAYSISSQLSSIQILQFTGTYTLNLLVLTIFLTPCILFLQINKNYKLLITTFFILLISLNSIFGSISLKNNNKQKNKNLDTVVKVISPKIEMNRYFNNEDLSVKIEELIFLSNPNLEKKTLFIFPEGIFSGINLNELIIYKKNFEKKFSDLHSIILGVTLYDNKKIYNTLTLINNNLEPIEIYKKNRLVPFGEYLPLEDKLSYFGLKKITQGYKSFSFSKKRDIIKIDNLSLLPLICYEIIYSGDINRGLKNFDVIVNISEDGWFGNTIGPKQHFNHAIYRSIEEGKNIIRSANNGISALIDPSGQVIEKIESTESGVITIKDLKPNKKTFFSKYGNKIFFYFTFFYISLIFFLKKKY